MEYSKSTNDDQMINMLLDRKANGKIVHINGKFQKSIYNKMKRKSSEPIERNKEIKKSAAGRSETPRYDWKKLCMFWEKDCVFDDSHPDRIDW